MALESHQSLVAGLLSLLIFSFLLRPWLSPLRSTPGPWLTRWTDAWYLYKVWQGDFEHTNRRLHQDLGPVVRYGPKRYSIDHSSALDQIYGHGTQLPKSQWYSSWSSPPPFTGPPPGLGTFSIFADQSIKRHAHNRKLFQSTYSLSSLVSYESYVNDCADLFAQRLQEIAAAGIAVDMRHWLQCYAFDVIGLITYGKRFGFLDRGEDVGGIISVLDGHLAYASLVGIYPSWHRPLFTLRNLVASGKQGTGREFIMNFTKDRIAEHRAEAKAVSLSRNEDDHDDYNNLEAPPATVGESKPEPFVSKFLAKNVEDPETFTMSHVVAGCVSNMIAGSDTTALSLAAVLYFLVKNERCLAALKEEIGSYTAEGRLSKSPTFVQTQDMPYLQAVIKESFRLHPAGGLPLERVVPPGGVTIAGTQFPEGTILGINAWVEHRNRSIFGQDADDFRPERWLTDDAEALRLMNRHSMAFGLGSRTCIGRHISMLEMCKVIPRIVRDFDLHLTGRLKDGEQEWSTENYWFVRPMDFMVTVRAS